MGSVPQTIYVPPLIPVCADGHLSVEAASPEEAKYFRPDTTYVLNEHFPGFSCDVWQRLRSLVD